MTLPKLRKKHINDRIKVLMAPGDCNKKRVCWGDISAIMEEHDPAIKEEFFGRMFTAIGPAPGICYYLIKKAAINLPKVTRNVMNAVLLDYLSAGISGEKAYKQRIISDLSKIETENPLFFQTTMEIYRNATKVNAFVRCAEETAMIYNLLSRNMELVQKARLPVNN
jgi:hypothetical protein